MTARYPATTLDIMPVALMAAHFTDVYFRATTLPAKAVVRKGQHSITACFMATTHRGTYRLARVPAVERQEGRSTIARLSATGSQGVEAAAEQRMAAGWTGAHSTTAFSGITQPNMAQTPTKAR